MISKEKLIALCRKEEEEEKGKGGEEKGVYLNNRKKNDGQIHPMK